MAGWRVPIAELQFLLDYDGWAMEQVFATAAKLDAAAFTEPAGPGHAVPRDTLLHCVGGMRTWRERLQGAPVAHTETASAQTSAAVRALWREEHERLRAYVAGLTAGELNAVLEQRRPDRVLVAERWQFVVHLVLHNMQHRSELAQALTLLGHSPGEIGLTAFLQQRGEAPAG
jgi:uncharacterized damage-inducible protein DinB